MPLAAAPGLRRGARGLGKASSGGSTSISTILEEALAAAPSGGATAKTPMLQARAGPPLRTSVRAPTRYCGGPKTLLDKKIDAYCRSRSEGRRGDRSRASRRKSPATSPLCASADWRSKTMPSPPILLRRRRAPTAIRADVRRLLGVREGLYEMDRPPSRDESTSRHSLQETSTRSSSLGDKACRWKPPYCLRAERLCSPDARPASAWSIILLLFEHTIGPTCCASMRHLDGPSTSTRE